jgi:hypothetical protein
VWGLGTLIEQMGHCQCGPDKEFEERSQEDVARFTSGGEPLYHVAQDPTHLAVSCVATGKLESRRLPRITQRDVLAQCLCPLGQ